MYYKRTSISNVIINEHRNINEYNSTCFEL